MLLRAMLIYGAHYQRALHAHATSISAVYSPETQPSLLIHLLVANLSTSLVINCSIHVSKFPATDKKSLYSTSNTADTRASISFNRRPQETQFTHFLKYPLVIILVPVCFYNRLRTQSFALWAVGTLTQNPREQLLLAIIPCSLANGNFLLRQCLLQQERIVPLVCRSARRRRRCTTRYADALGDPAGGNAKGSSKHGDGIK